MSISLVSFNPSGIMGTLTVSLQQSDDSFLNVRCMYFNAKLTYLLTMLKETCIVKTVPNLSVW